MGLLRICYTHLFATGTQRLSRSYLMKLLSVLGTLYVELWPSL